MRKMREQIKIKKNSFISSYGVRPVKGGRNPFALPLTGRTE